MLETNTLFLIGGGLGLVLFLVGLVSLLTERRSVVDERLGRYAETGGMISVPGDEEAGKKNRTSLIIDFINQIAEGTDLYESVSRHLVRADLKFRPGEYFILIVASALSVGILGAIVGRSVAFGVLSGIFGIFLPPLYVLQMQKRRRKMFDQQLGDMLNLVVNGLRAGFSTLQAMEAVSRELPAPISVEFHRVVQEIQLGIAMEDALFHLLRRIDSDDLDLVVTAINVQREVGGNLAVILDTISYTIRERVRIKGEIAALTAQGQMTAWVISLLPVLLVVLLFLINREYIMTFFDPGTRVCGVVMLISAALMIVLGFAITQKIVRIDI
ncbi:MAG: type II secretion system F family protein [Anaerolineales bacterium]|nr:type II secretion system F family protein [Anaerolineales bacterium]